MRWTYGGYLRRVKVSALVDIIEKAGFFFSIESYFRPYFRPY